MSLRGLSLNEKDKESHHKGKERNRFRERKPQDGVREQLLLNLRVASKRVQKGAKNKTNPDTGTSNPNSGRSRPDRL